MESGNAERKLIFFRRDKPSRAKITLVGSLLGFFLPTGWISGKFVIKESSRQRKKKKRDDDYDDDDEY